MEEKSLQSLPPGVLDILMRGAGVKEKCRLQAVCHAFLDILHDADRALWGSIHLERDFPEEVPSHARFRWVMKRLRAFTCISNIDSQRMGKACMPGFAMLLPELACKLRSTGRTCSVHLFMPIRVVASLFKDPLEPGWDIHTYWERTAYCLTKLDVSVPNSLLNRLISSLCKLTALEGLQLSGCHHPKYAEPSRGDTNVHLQLPQLTSLLIADIWYEGDTDMLLDCPRLQLLHLCNIKPLYRLEVFAQDLAKLAIWDCRKGATDGCLSLSQFRGLTSLTFCDTYGWGSFTEQVHLLPKLEKLVLRRVLHFLAHLPARLEEVDIVEHYYKPGIRRQLLSLPLLQSLRLVNYTSEPWHLWSELDALVLMSTLKKVRLISDCWDCTNIQKRAPETHRKLKETADRFGKSGRDLTFGISLS